MVSKTFLKVMGFCGSLLLFGLCRYLRSACPRTRLRRHRGRRLADSINLGLCRIHRMGLLVGS